MSEFGDLEVGTGVVVWRDNHVLLGKRKGSHGAGQWAFPGGTFDPEEDEDPLDTAQREFEEKTGLPAHCGYWKQSYYWHYDPFPEAGRHFITLYFRVVVPGDAEPKVMELDKMDEWRFFLPYKFPTNLFVGVNALGLIEKLADNG